MIAALPTSQSPACKGTEFPVSKGPRNALFVNSLRGISLTCLSPQKLVSPNGCKKSRKGSHLLSWHSGVGRTICEDGFYTSAGTQTRRQGWFMFGRIRGVWEMTHQVSSVTLRSSTIGVRDGSFADQRFFRPFLMWLMFPHLCQGWCDAYSTHFLRSHHYGSGPSMRGKSGIT